MALVTTLSRSNRVSTRRDKYYIGERYRESTFAALLKTNQQYTFDNEHISCEKNKQTNNMRSMKGSLSIARRYVGFRWEI